MQACVSIETSVLSVIIVVSLSYSSVLTGMC